MKRLQQTILAMTLTLSLSATAFSGTITGSWNSDAGAFNQYEMLTKALYLLLGLVW